MNKKESNIITLKLEYTCTDLEAIKDIQRRYSNLLRFTYNRLKKSTEKLSTAELSFMMKGCYNVNLDSWFFASAQYDARAMIEADEALNIKKRVFGGKQNNILRSQNKITREEYLENRLSPIYSVGEAGYKGNRKFKIIDYKTILFKPSKKEKYFLTLKGLSRNYKKYFDLLIQHQEIKDLAITYKLNQKYIYITFDLGKLEVGDIEATFIKDRVFAIDLNPDFVGYSVVDWKNSTEFKVISSGVISIKPLNDLDRKLKVSSNDKQRKYITNKRKYEIIEICNKLVTLAKHYQCEIFSMEDLNIKARDAKKGSSFNRIVNNQWCRNLFVSQIRKRLKLSLISLQEVIPNYSSFIGNLAYRYLELPDMCLSSIEIGRRGYEFYHQYVLKDKKKQKNIVINTDPQVLANITLSLEELSFVEPWESILELYSKIKKSKLRYRFQLNENDAVFSKYYSKQKVKLYAYI